MLYTEFHLAVNLRDNIPEHVIKVLEYMMSPVCESAPSKVPNHKFFKTERWTMMLSCDSDYCPGATVHRLKKTFSGISLTVHSNFKNIDEVQSFLDWIEPYVALSHGKHNRVFAGYYKEEDKEEPHLIYFEKECKNG